MIFRRRRTRIEIEHTIVRVQAVQPPTEPAAHWVEGAPPMRSPSKTERSTYPVLELPHAADLSQETRK
jgi:hypothetical protein